MLRKLLNDIVPKTDFEFPVVIASILTCFEVYGQKGGIVGGAVRDHVLEKEIRDYDVYIQTDAIDFKSDVSELAIHARKFGCTIYNISANSHYEGQNIVGIYKLTTEDGTVIDIIFGILRMEEYVEDFTCSLSKIYYDVLKGKIIQTEDFKESVRTKVCWICNNRGSHPVVIEDYVDKIELKYPEYTFTEE